MKVNICESPKKNPEIVLFLVSSAWGASMYLEYLFTTVFSTPKETTVRMLVNDYITIWLESFSASSYLTLRPVLNLVLIAPASMTRGMKPSATKAVLHSYAKAIMTAVMKVVAEPTMI